MTKTTSTSPEEVRASVASLYEQVLDKRKAERDKMLDEKRKRKEAEALEKEAKKINEDGSKKSKSERREQELEAWKEIIVGLTGDDLEYSSPKKNRKKYRKWIGEDETPVLTPKPKKAKKKNYRKEFEPELNMLKTIVADQNRFTADLQRRFQNAAGPATKDAMPLNKTLVELAAAVNASRSNSLGLLREIGSLKKTIAELYMKQAKNDAEGGAAGFNPTDIALMGSNIASSMFGDNSGATPTPYAPEGTPESGNAFGPIQATATPVPGVSIPGASIAATPVAQVQEFDPDTWGGPELPSDAVKFENIPKEIVVEWDKANDRARFKALSRETGQELVGCPVPTSDPKRLVFNEKDKIVRGEFDETYRLEIVS